MKKLSNIDIIDYLYQSYAKVDGLWFMKTEEKFGFDKALEIDREVWKIIPKIQARILKSKLEAENEADIFLECLKIKLKNDNFKFNLIKNKNYQSIGTNKSGDTIKVSINYCPWHEIMIKSGRKTLSEKIGSSICNTEYSIFSGEFEGNIKFELRSRICNGNKNCEFIFKKH
ncbi:MAG: L-2-amino-thiazoline-4-carboxylic acid hydrolase [Actinobacteria bacterium]|nr:L-2-amino-thiazoline-4-carboxylic acid hydrolase [Actinomycetota bacterium]